MSRSHIYRYGYLHGFASSHLSVKGVDLRRRLRDVGVNLELLELNVPSFEAQTVSAALAEIDRFDADTPSGTRLRLIGSSLGGYLAALWSATRPGRTAGLVLLCPGFDLPNRWSALIAPEALAEWERTGAMDIEDASGRRRPLHWAFIEDLRRHPAWPEVACPTCIVHGTRDEVVPIAGTRRYAADRPLVEVVEVDDDHRLHASRARIAAEVCRLFKLC